MYIFKTKQQTGIYIYPAIEDISLVKQDEIYKKNSKVEVLRRRQIKVKNILS